MFFEGKKGGALASIVHSHLQHGDPQVRSVIKNMLATVATPIFQTVLKWIFDGELDDNFHEVQKKNDFNKLQSISRTADHQYSINS